MCRRDGSLWWLAALLGLLLLFAARTASAQETSVSAPTPNMLSQELLLPSGSRTSNEAWTYLMQEWSEFGPIWDALMMQLEASEIGISELPFYLASTRGQLDSLTTSLAEETKARQEAEHSRDFWKTGTITAGVVAITTTGALALVLALIF